MSKIAEEIDKEYRLKQIYRKLRRNRCKDKKCTKCRFQVICKECDKEWKK